MTISNSPVLPRLVDSRLLLVMLALSTGACATQVGETGAMGEPGAMGVDGIDGLDGLDGEDGVQGIQGIQGIQGVPGSFPGTLVATNGNNGTVSCDTFCNDFNDQWGMAGSCVATRLNLNQNPVPPSMVGKNGKYIPCGARPADVFPGVWIPGTDGVTCQCVTF